MRKFLVLAFAFGFLFVPFLVMAATDTSNLQASATVAAKCKISSVGDLSFGNYDPTSSDPTDTNGNVTIQCVKRTNYDVYISGTRQMTGPEDEILNFQIYSDSGRTQIFPSSSPGITGQASNASPIQIDAYGRIPAQQDVGAGNFSATLTATVSY